jgi:methionyl-tRNA formyltransferase
VERAIMAGDAHTGVSIMRLTAGLDSGPVCLVADEPIEAHDSYGSLAPRLQALSSELLLRVLDETAAGDPPEFVEQDESGVTYAEKIGAVDRLLDPARPADELERVVRALHPHIGARVALTDGTLLGVHEAALVEPDGDRGPHGDGTLGVIADEDGRLLLVCSDGALQLLRVQPPGGRPMDAGSYLRGHGAPGRR